eukprot:TRINITY_DN10191_c0_g1_i1.p1 TRINITY_DN10191_c0_g1~~TRINITY_DN10191_c0_g1_i1.p1  ORF type:complete len:193 (-),score=36.65 TRINITY_DN10191_c0_g1_i1:145-693(-)
MISRFCSATASQQFSFYRHMTRSAATTTIAASSLIRTPDVTAVRAKRRAPLHKPPFVLSLDLGVKKLAYCLYDTNEKRIIEWKRIDLEDAGVNSASVEDVVDYFDAFMTDNGTFFQRDCHVLIENQVSARLRVIQAIAYTVFRSKATTQIVNPRKVRQHLISALARGQRTRKPVLSSVRVVY